MSLTEAQYYTRRASEQIDRATNARDDEIARVHCELTELYLSRARDAVDEEFRDAVAPVRPRLKLSAA